MISLDTFIICAEEWKRLEAAEDFFANWKLKSARNRGEACLLKRFTKATTKGGNSAPETDSLVRKATPRYGSAQDHNSVVSVYFVDVTIAYSPVYRVPVLYFNILDSTGIPLRPADLTKYMSRTYEVEKGSSASMVTPILSMEEHPFDSNVAYMIHPCETVRHMQTLTLCSSQSDHETRRTYLLRWWSLYGRLLDIHFPLLQVANAFK